MAPSLLMRPTELGPVHRHETRYHRINQIAGAGWSGVQHCLRPDRHRERDYRYVGSYGNWGNAGTTMVEPRIPAKLVAEAVVHMANLSLEANIPFVTIMASGMPLYGRG